MHKITLLWCWCWICGVLDFLITPLATFWLACNLAGLLLQVLTFSYCWLDQLPVDLLIAGIWMVELLLWVFLWAWSSSGEFLEWGKWCRVWARVGVHEKKSDAFSPAPTSVTSVPWMCLWQHMHAGVCKLCVCLHDPDFWREICCPTLDLILMPFLFPWLPSGFVSMPMMLCWGEVLLWTYTNLDHH